jgi:hypothetical protein
MKDFQEALARFRDAVRQEGERSEIPDLHALLERERPARSPGLRRTNVAWAAAAAAALMLAAVPAYQNVLQRERVAEQEKADTLLMQQVNAGLSRSVPRAMTPLLGWAPVANGEAGK